MHREFTKSSVVLCLVHEILDAMGKSEGAGGDACDSLKANEGGNREAVSVIFHSSDTSCEFSYVRFTVLSGLAERLVTVL